MWAVSQVWSVGCGPVGRKAQACLESGWSLQMHCAGSGGGGHVACQEMQRRPAGFLVLESCVLFAAGACRQFPVLFPTPNESSFRTLTCLLAQPQEGNGAACPSSPRLCLNSEHPKRGRSVEASLPCWSAQRTSGFLLDGSPQVCPGGSVWGSGFCGKLWW